MENLSELVTSYNTLSENQTSSNQLETSVNQVPPLPSQKISDNQTPPELPVYQTPYPSKRFSRRGLIVGGIISGLAMLLYKGCRDRKNEKIAETKKGEETIRRLEEQLERKRQEEQRTIYARQEIERKRLEEQKDTEMHKLTDSEFAEYMRLYKIKYSQKSKDEQERFETLEKKMDAIKSNPSKALSLMDESLRREYDSFKRDQDEFKAYFSRVKEDYDKNAPGYFDNLIGSLVLLPAGIAAQGIHGGLGLDPNNAPNPIIDTRNMTREEKYERIYGYIKEYWEYDSEYDKNRASSSDKDLILYFYYTRYKGGRFTKRLE
jgi:hypothetical protein